MSIQYQERWVSRDSIQIWTESFGNIQDPAVILVIGAGAISTSYSDDFCGEIANAGYFVLRYDQRDYGKSTKFPQIQSEALSDPELLKKELPYRIEDLVEDLRVIMDDYGISKAHIVGHSMGGMITQLFTAKHPKRLLSFTSISVAPASPKCEIEPIPKETQEKLYANIPSGNFEQDVDGWLASYKILNGTMEFDIDQAREYVREIYERDPHANVAWSHIGVQCLLPDYLNQFKNNRVPGLILHGEEDPLQPVSYAAAVHEMIKNTKLTILPRLGHMFFNREAQKLILSHLLEHFALN